MRGLAGRWLAPLVVGWLAAASIAQGGGWAARPDDVRELLTRSAAAGEPAADEDLRAIVAELGALERPDDFARWAVVRAARELAARVPRDAAASADRLAWLEIAWEHSRARGTKARSTTARIALDAAMCLRDAGRDDEALDLLLAAHDGLDTADRIRPYVLVALADLARLRLEWSTTEELLDDAEAGLSDEPIYDALRVAIDGQRGRLYIALGLPDRAAPFIERAVERARALHEAGRTDWGAWISALAHLAAMRLATDRPARLAEELEAFLESTEIPEGSATGELGLTVQLGRAHQRLGRDDPTHYDRARELLEGALGDPRLRAIDRHTAQTRLAMLELATGDPSAARARIAAAEQQLERDEFGPLEHAFVAAIALAVEAEGGNDPGALAERLAVLRARFADVAAAWRESPVRPGGLGPLRYERTRRILSELIHGACLVAGERDGARIGLEALFEAQRAGTLARRMATGGAVLDDARALIPRRGGLLLILPSEAQTHVFAWDRAGLAHESVRIDASFERDLEVVWAATTRAPAGDRARLDRERARLVELTDRLADRLLFGGVRAKLLRWSEVSVIGAELLGEHAFESLSIDGVPLGRRVAVSVLPSLPVGIALLERAGRREPGRGLLLAAFLDEDAGLWDARARELARTLGPGSRTLTGAGVSWAAIVDALGDPPRIATIVAHGARAPERERSAGVDLASGFLGAEEIEACPVRLPEVVFAASCGVGSGPGRLGDAASGHLGGAILFAGASTVVLPMVDVEVEATWDLLEHAHRRLAEGASPAEALRLARVELAERPELDHPFFQSTLRVLGLGHRPVYPGREPPRPQPAPWWIAAAGVAIAWAASRALRVEPARG